MISTKKVAISIFAAIALKKLVEVIIATRRRNHLLDKAQRKRSERDTQIAKEFTPTYELNEEIVSLVLNSTVNDLIKLLNDDKLTSEQILRVYHNRAITIGLRLELIADSNFPEALEAAKRCDELRKNTPKEERHRLGNLFGIPICIKDSIDQKGLDSTCGLAKNCLKPCVEDGGIIKILKAQGAIPFIRSNVPQCLRAFDCVNHIWGRGLNPCNIYRIVGGSSGGDGGLVAAKCTPIGYGSDAYGSIRLPAAFTGVCGFKPTSGRYPSAGHTMVAARESLKFTFLTSSTGPIARCTDDVALVVKSMITPEFKSYDLSSPFIPWNEEKYKSKAKLKIGYVTSEDFFGAARSCRRAVKEAVTALEKIGHEVTEIKIPNFEEICLSVICLLTSEGNAEGIKEALDGENPTPDLSFFVELAEFSNTAKKFIGLLAHKRTKNILEQTLLRSPSELALAIDKILNLRDNFLKYFVDNNLDAIVMPASALPAFKHGYGTFLLPAACYLWLANIANLPSGVVPVTKVKPGEDIYTAKDSIHSDNQLFMRSQECMQGSLGLPVGVQVVTLPWEDEKCLNVMKAIEENVEINILPDIK